MFNAGVTCSMLESRAQCWNHVLNAGVTCSMLESRAQCWNHVIGVKGLEMSCEGDLLLNTNNNIGVLAAWNVGQQTEDHIGLGIPGILLKQTNNG